MKTDVSVRGGRLLLTLETESASLDAKLTTKYSKYGAEQLRDRLNLLIPALD